MMPSRRNKFFPRITGTVEDRFWSKISPEPNTGCWLWCGDDNGYYGNISGTYNRLTKKAPRLLAHRLSYEIHFGEIPKNQEIDHKCRMKLCVNPDHLNLSGHRANVLAIPPGIRGNNQIKTHCRHGHELIGSNLQFDHRGHARCRQCQNLHYRNYRKRRNERG